MANHRVDLDGQRFGMLVVLERAGKNRTGISTWRCRCDCGIVKEGILYHHLVKGDTRSCGCQRGRKAVGAVVKPTPVVAAPSSSMNGSGVRLPDSIKNWGAQYAIKPNIDPAQLAGLLKKEEK